MTKDISLTIKLCTAVDEWSDADEIEIATKIIVIENWACSSRADRMDCGCRSNFGGRCHISHRGDACDREQQHQRCAERPCSGAHDRAGLIGSNRLELFGQGSRKKDRSEHSKKVSVTNLRQAEVQDPEQHQDSQPGQSHAAVKRETKGAKHHDFECAKMRKI